MIMQLYAMKDELTGFMSPLAEVNDDVALRNWKYAVFESSSIKAAPADYALYMLGAYDTETGMIIPEKVPKCLLRANSIVKKGESE